MRPHSLVGRTGNGLPKVMPRTNFSVSRPAVPLPTAMRSTAWVLHSPIRVSRAGPGAVSGWMVPVAATFPGASRQTSLQPVPVSGVDCEDTFFSGGCGEEEEEEVVGKDGDGFGVGTFLECVEELTFE